MQHSNGNETLGIEEEVINNFLVKTFHTLIRAVCS